MEFAFVRLGVGFKQAVNKKNYVLSQIKYQQVLKHSCTNCFVGISYIYIHLG